MKLSVRGQFSISTAALRIFKRMGRGVCISIEILKLMLGGLRMGRTLQAAVLIPTNIQL
jgi:hypothetical protein